MEDIKKMFGFLNRFCLILFRVVLASHDFHYALLFKCENFAESSSSRFNLQFGTLIRLLVKICISVIGVDDAIKG